MSATIPSRDITGNCEGECRDRVLEGEELRQAEINAANVDYDEPSRTVPWASSRNAPPGAMGGRV